MFVASYIIFYLFIFWDSWGEGYGV